MLGHITSKTTVGGGLFVTLHITLGKGDDERTGHIRRYMAEAQASQQAERVITRVVGVEPIDYLSGSQVVRLAHRRPWAIVTRMAYCYSAERRNTTLFGQDTASAPSVSPSSITPSSLAGSLRRTICRLFCGRGAFATSVQAWPCSSSSKRKTRKRNHAITHGALATADRMVLAGLPASPTRRDCPAALFLGRIGRGWFTGSGLRERAGRPPRSAALSVDARTASTNRRFRVLVAYAVPTAGTGSASQLERPTAEDAVAEVGEALVEE